MAILLTGVSTRMADAQERAYFVTYDHHLEESDSLEVGLNPVVGTQRAGNGFLASWLELEYGVKGWWTTEAYLEGQGTRHEGAALTGVRWEHRFRPLMLEHRVNPVLYVEYAWLSDADKTLREVVGHDVEAEHAEPLAKTRHAREHEIEAKLILSSGVRDWNLSENLVVEKRLGAGAWEFGYAIGVSRPVGLAASPRRCSLCAENFAVGLEMYGGLGETGDLSLRETSHYLGAVLAWSLPSGTGIRVSPTLGLSRDSHRFLLRVGIAHEVPGFMRRLARR